MSEGQEAYKILADEVNHLTSLPTACFKILELSKDENSTARDIEREIIKDPGIATQVLRMANSAFYGLSSRIDTLSRAVSIIGTKRISNIVLAVSTIKSMQQLKNEIISLENFWSHSISCGIIASHLAKHCGHRDSESFFIAGLLHDIGQLVLFKKRPDEVRQALDRMQDDSSYNDIYIYERKILGFDHMQLGGELSKKWLLPDNLIECISYHHEPTKAIICPFDVAIVHIANTLSNIAELHSENFDSAPPVNPLAWKVTNLNPEICIEILHQCEEENKATQAILMVA